MASLSNMRAALVVRALVSRSTKTPTVMGYMREFAPPESTSVTLARVYSTTRHHRAQNSSIAPLLCNAR